jgi:hypothetical protein
MLASAVKFVLMPEQTQFVFCILYFKLENLHNLGLACIAMSTEYFKSEDVHFLTDLLKHCFRLSV